MSNDLDPVVFEVMAMIEGAIANLSEVQAKIAETAATVSEESAKMKESAHEAGAGFKEMGEAMGAFAAFDLLKESVSVAADAAGSVQVLDQAIKNAGGSVEEMTPAMDSVREQMTKLGFVSAETSKGMQGMVAMIGNPTKALNLMGLAADVARARHIDLQQAVRLVGMAATGHVQLLARLGIQTKDAAGHTLSAAAAVQMLGEKFKGTAQSYAGSMAGQVDVMKAQMDDAKEKIGNALIPVLTKLTPIFTSIATTVANDVIPPLNFLSNLYMSHKELINLLVVALLAGYAATKVWGGMVAAYNMVVKTAEAATVAWTVVTKGLTVAQEGENAAMEANPIGLIIGLIAALVAVLIYAWNHSKTFRDVLVGVWHDIEKAAGAAVAFVINYGLKPLVDAYLWAAKEIVKAADAMLGWVPGMGSALDSAKKAIEQFGASTDATLEGWAASANKWGDSVTSTISKVKSATGEGDKGFNMNSNWSSGLSNTSTQAAAAQAAAAKKAAAEAAKAAKKAAEEKAREAAKAKREHEKLVKEHHKKLLEEEKKHQAELLKEQKAAAKLAAEEAKKSAAEAAAQKKADAQAAKDALQKQLDDTRLQLQIAKNQINQMNGQHDLELVNGQMANVGTSLLNMGYAGQSPVHVTVNVAGSVTTQQQLVNSVQQGLLVNQRTNSSLGIN